MFINYKIGYYYYYYRYNCIFLSIIQYIVLFFTYLLAWQILKSIFDVVGLWGHSDDLVPNNQPKKLIKLTCRVLDSNRSFKKQEASQVHIILTFIMR